MGWRAPGTATISLALAATIACLAPADAASARTETIRWTHPDASRVTGFRIRIGTSSGSYGTTVEAGKPTPSGGVYSHTISVADTATVYAVISAFNASQQSTNSNERVLRKASSNSAFARYVKSDSLPQPNDCRSAADAVMIRAWVSFKASTKPPE